MRDIELAIHEKAVGLAKRFKQTEMDLISVLQEVRRLDIYHKLGFRTMFSYCTDCLKLTRDNAYTYLKISEKSEQIPELKEALVKGDISLTNARRIAPVITQDNKEVWLEKASVLSQNSLEKELVKVAPRKVLPDRIKPLTRDTSEIRCAIPSEYDGLIQKARDILSQKNRRAMGTGETIVEALKFLVNKLDRVEKARKALAKPRSIEKKKGFVARQRNNRTLIPAKTKHELILRHNHQCGFPGCTEKKWLDTHHIKPITRGGTHELSNLFLACSAHHKMIHRGQVGPGPWVIA